MNPVLEVLVTVPGHRKFNKGKKLTTREELDEASPDCRLKNNLPVFLEIKGMSLLGCLESYGQNAWILNTNTGDTSFEICTQGNSTLPNDMLKIVNHQRPIGQIECNLFEAILVED